MRYHNNEATGLIYPGGKGHCYQKIINLIPPHRRYIEPFAGGGAVLRHKRPAECNIAIDRDPQAIETLSTIARNGDASAEWQFLCTDALEWLTHFEFDHRDFVYADPPYLMSSRRQHRQLYRYELTNANHQRLLDTLIALPCKVMLSGYWSKLYETRLVDWYTVTFEAQTRGGSPATEWLWMNYPPPTELHDYRYLGNDFRERERIKRKTARWVAKLCQMPTLERLAISAAIAELNDNGQHR